MTQGRDGRFEVLTPSYAPDFELCRDLVASVGRFAPPGTRHRLVVPRTDVALFSELASDTVVVERVDQVLPRSFRRLPGLNLWLNLRSPWPPVRGWIAQQVVKLAATANSTADAVLVVDSDMVFVRPFSLADYADDQVLTSYRLPEAIHPAMTDHLGWDEVARDLLGLPAKPPGDGPDYICWPCLWSPRIVRELLAAVEAHERVPWATAVARRLRFSEMFLYGVYVDEVVAKREPVDFRDSMNSALHSEERALSEDDLRAFFASVRPTDLAVMMSAKSGTDLEARRRAIARFLAGETGA